MAPIKWPPRLSETHHGHAGWPASIVQPAAMILRRKAGMPCEYCEQPMARSGKLRATRDHVFPKARGYRLRDLNGFNTALVCQNCNTSKKGHDIVEWWWRLTNGGDPRAPIVFKVIERIWFAGAMPTGDGKHFSALATALGQSGGKS
jgi:HNH endonuclease